LPKLEQLRYHPRLAHCNLFDSIHMRFPAVLYSLCILLVVSACGGDRTDQPPVATATVTLSREKAAIGSPLAITYKFLPSDRKIDGDYWVFLHVLDQDGERMWGDDHQPPVPTSTWKPGQAVEYTRTVFLPNYPYIGSAEVRIGLYMPSTGERLPLSGTEVSRREYRVANLQVLPRSENIFLIYKDGWYATETHSQDPTIEWQWTRKAATISFRNPRKDSTFYLEYDARTDLFTAPQQITVKIGDQTIGTFTADSRDTKLVTLPVSAAQLGSGDVTELVLEVDRTFQPGSGDTRELGIRVFNAFIQPK
jgi:hypothetical protein